MPVHDIANIICLLPVTDMDGEQISAFLSQSGRLERSGNTRSPRLPPHELLSRLFQKEMIRRNLVWKTAMETSSQDSVSIYVRNGLGVGLAVQTPELQRDSQLRVLSLSGFPNLPIGVAGQAR